MNGEGPPAISPWRERSVKRTGTRWLTAIVRRAALAALVAGALMPVSPAVAGPERPPVCPYIKGC